MTQGFAGGCLCRGIRYEADIAPQSVAFCQCRDCQYISGGEPAAIVLVNSRAFRIVEGHPNTFRSVGDAGGEVSRHFCPTCGTPLYSEVSTSPNVVFVKAGTMDDSHGLKPSVMVYMQSAQPWSHQPGDMPTYPKMPS